jgi:carboxypeptidase D
MLLTALSFYSGTGLAAEPTVTASALGKGAGPRLGTITRVELTLTNRSELNRLVQEGYDIDSVNGLKVLIYCDADELAALRGEGWSMSLLPPPTVAPGRTLGSYNDWTNMTAMLLAYKSNYPSICRLVSLGKSVQGRDLWAMKITSNPDQPADKARFKYISTMHGNEPVGTEMCLYLLDRLCTGYATGDGRVLNLVTNVEIWLLPLMNPDGRQANPPSRYNANSYDLNRSFPEGSGTNLGNLLWGPTWSTNGLQPEVGEVMDWTAAGHFTLGANFHTGDLVVNYPYDNDNMGSVLSPSPDDALLQAMSLTYSSNNPPMWSGGSFPNGIVNGAAWYAISGGMQDWNYRYVGCFDVTIELSFYQWPDPPATQLPTYWSQNEESMLAYIEWVLRGVRGLIRDAQSGRPVGASVRVEGYPHLVFSDPTVGDYHRILLPGAYTLWFNAPGYIPQRVPNVVVGGTNATRLDIALQPVSARFAAKVDFQPAGTAIPTGFLADSGAAFGSRGGGYSYGWETDLASGTVVTRNAGRSQDLRYDSLAQMQAGGSHSWAMAVPNGPYSVLMAAGDPAYSTGLYRVAAQGVVLLDGAPSASNRWVEGIGTVVVTDGRLTLSNGPGAMSNRLDYVEISAIEPTTITQWRALYFGTTNNSGAAADNADPDGDGLPNLVEYALGLNPTHFDSSSELVPLIVQTDQAIWFGGSFPRDLNPTDLTLSFQSANSMPASAWSNLATFSYGSGWTGPGLVTETAVSPNLVNVRIVLPQPMSYATNAFLRLLIAR